MTGATFPPISPLPSVDGHGFTLLTGGAARLDALVEMIDGAGRTVDFLFYILSCDTAGQRTAEALLRAARRGVAVRVLLDGFGCADMREGFLDDLVGAGAEVCRFHPSYGRRYLLRNHQKLLIVDGDRALVGGANVEEPYLCDEGDERWRDLWLRIDAPKGTGGDHLITRLSAYYEAIHAWTHAPKSRIRTLRRLLVDHSDQQGALQIKLTGPMRRYSPWRRAIVAELLRVRRLDMIAAYFAPPPNILRRIGAVARRGGQVRIVNAAHSDNGATIPAARHTYAKLMRAGVEIYEYQPAKLHTKLYLADDVTYLGSSNFDVRSLYLNVEIMIRIDDAAFTAAMRDFVEAEIGDSKRIVATEFARSNLWTRARRRAAYYLVTALDYSLTRRINFGVE